MFYTALATNVLAKSLVENAGIQTPSWFEWFFYFLPVGIILLLSVPILTYYIYPPTIKISKDIPVWASSELAKMGGVTRKEIIMCMLAGLALILWIFGNIIGIHPTVSALAVLCLMVLFKIISWDDILKNKAAWNVFIWFATMVTLAGGLDNVGFLDWFAGKITSAVSSYSPAFILVILLLVFYFLHYLFASSTAHATALLALFLVAGSNISGMNSSLLTLVLLYSLGLMGILTPYATGASPIWYGLGYIESKTYWKLGAIFGVIFIVVLILVGIPWIKLWI
jgi:anion transporter